MLSSSVLCFIVHVLPYTVKLLWENFRNLRGKWSFVKKPSWWHACILILPINTAIDSWENIYGIVNNHENCECFPPWKFCLCTYRMLGKLAGIKIWHLHPHIFNHWINIWWLQNKVKYNFYKSFWENIVTILVNKVWRNECIYIYIYQYVYEVYTMNFVTMKVCHYY